MVSGVNNIQQSILQPQFSPQQSSSAYTATSSPTSFDIEDEAIISSQAKLQNELEKFNAGGDNLVNLVVAGVMAKTTVAAEVNVMDTKKDMFDEILKMGE